MKVLRWIWRRWLRFAEIFGNVQMIIILSLIYWIMIPFLAIPMKLLSDPLQLRVRRQASWTEHPANVDILGSMKRQG